MSFSWRPWRGPSVQQLQQQGWDNLLLLRLLAAATVIYGHAFAVKAGPVEHDFIASAGWGEGIYTASLAVDAFFFISGFLVTGSWLRQQSLRRYLQARAARVLPAYWVLLLLSVLLLGPLYTRLDLHAYFADAQTWGYLWGNLIYAHRWALPGVLDSNPNPASINGSLWTLRPEVMAYLALAGAGLLGLLLRPAWFALAVPLVIVLLLVLTPRYFSPEYQRVFMLFGLGVCCWMARARLPLNLGLLLALPALAWYLHGSALFTPALMLSIGYSCLWLAYVPPLQRLQPPGDYSYGVYLWGYPVQQIVVFHSGSESALLITVVSVLLAGILAILSWHLIEAPLLQRLRPARPDRPQRV